MTSEKNKTLNEMELVVGDWSDDGHGKHEDIRVLVNKTHIEVFEGYRKACQITGIQFHCSERVAGWNELGTPDFTGTAPDENEPGDAVARYSARHEWALRVEQMCEYEEYKLTDYAKEALAEYPNVVTQFEEGGGTVGERFACGWFEFAKIAIPDLVWRFAPKTSVPRINGYWQEGRNCSFGYGIYE